MRPVKAEPKQTESRGISFDKEELKEAERLGIKVPEICRKAVRDEVYAKRFTLNKVDGPLPGGVK